jgi:hypothetical protein
MNILRQFFTANAKLRSPSMSLKTMEMHQTIVKGIHPGADRQRGLVDR